jgi:hypothetical protein
MLDGFTTSPTHMFYLPQYKKLSIFFLNLYVAEKWDEAKYQNYQYCLEILSILVVLKLLGFHLFNLTGDKAFSFYGLAIGMILVELQLLSFHPFNLIGENTFFFIVSPSV